MFFDYPNQFKPSKNNPSMIEFPLPVAIAAVIHEHKILLLQRIKGSYIGFWGLPGGKIKKHEHVSEAAVREIQEETGLTPAFKQHLGFVSEHLVEDRKVFQHFLLHLCHLEVSSPNFTGGKEGDLQWFDLGSLQNHQNHIIPSDYLMIKNMILARNGNYFNCVVEKQGEEHVLRKFE